MTQVTRNRSTTILAMLALAVLATGCGGSGEESPTAAGGGLSAADVEFQSLQLANQARSAENVQPQLGQDCRKGIVGGKCTGGSHGTRCGGPDKFK